MLALKGSYLLVCMVCSKIFCLAQVFVLCCMAMTAPAWHVRVFVVSCCASDMKRWPVCCSVVASVLCSTHTAESVTYLGQRPLLRTDCRVSHLCGPRAHLGCCPWFKHGSSVCVVSLSLSLSLSAAMMATAAMRAAAQSCFIQLEPLMKQPSLAAYMKPHFICKLYAHIY